MLKKAIFNVNVTWIMLWNMKSLLSTRLSNRRSTFFFIHLRWKNKLIFWRGCCVKPLYNVLSIYLYRKFCEHPKYFFFFYQSSLYHISEEQAQVRLHNLIIPYYMWLTCFLHSKFIIGEDCQWLNSSRSTHKSRLTFKRVCHLN